MQHPLNPTARLREAREAKGLSCRQLAETTRLSARTIEALEGGRLSALPEGIYRRAIVRCLASEVGLDPDQLLREFSAAYPVQLPPPESNIGAAPPKPSRNLPKVTTLIGAVLPLLAGVSYFAWASTRGSEGKAVVDSESAPALLRPEIQAAGGFAAASDPLQRPVVVIVTVSSRCLLRIVSDGREVVGRTVDQGERIQIELGEDIWLFSDNASAVQFSINGQAGRPLGATDDLLAVRIGRDDYQDFLADN